MNINGIIVGAAVFLIIGICHPIVIKLEYYYGKQSWWVMALAGAFFAGISLFVHNLVLSTILGSAAFSCFWGIQFLGHPRNHRPGETGAEGLVPGESPTA